jgi:hypothetical protein
MDVNMWCYDNDNRNIADYWIHVMYVYVHMYLYIYILCRAIIKRYIISIHSTESLVDGSMYYQKRSKKSWIRIDLYYNVNRFFYTMMLRYM